MQIEPRISVFPKVLLSKSLFIPSILFYLACILNGHPVLFCCCCPIFFAAPEIKRALFQRETFMHIEDKCSMKKLLSAYFFSPPSFSQYFYNISGLGWLRPAALQHHPNSSFLRCKTKNPHERVSLKRQDSLLLVVLRLLNFFAPLGVSSLTLLLFQNFGYKVCSYPIIASMRSPP